MGAIASAKPTRHLRVLPLRAMSDERLAELAGVGHTEAFETLYERYRQDLARYCRSIVRDADDAKDALQNTMLSVLGALRVGRPNGPLRPWLYRIAHNESISVIRRRRPHEELSNETPDRADTERIYASRDRLDSLLVDLRSLPERQRGALVMRELGGLGYDEIGDALRTSPVSARKAVFEARVALHDLADARETDCSDIRRRISDGDGRVLRARGIRSHLRSCVSCSAFERGLHERRGTFALIPMLPALPVAALLGIALPGGGGGSTSGLAIGGSAAGGSALGGASVAAVKGIALGGAIAVAGAGVLAGSGIDSHVKHHRPAPLAAVHAGPTLRAGVVTARLAHAASTAGLLPAPRPAASPAGAPARVTTPPAGAGIRPASNPNARGPSASVPVSASTPTVPAPGTSGTKTGPTATPVGPTATTTGPTATPVGPIATPTSTTPSAAATTTPPSVVSVVSVVTTILQNALQGAGANLASAETQAGQALASAGALPGTAAATVQGILATILHGGHG